MIDTHHEKGLRIIRKSLHETAVHLKTILDTVIMVEEIADVCQSMPIHDSVNLVFFLFFPFLSFIKLGGHHIKMKLVFNRFILYFKILIEILEHRHSLFLSAVKKESFRIRDGLHPFTTQFE